MNMTAFAILTGKSLKTAVASYGKTAATFTEKTHQLAYSALNHVEQHHDAIYCNAIYSATPKNYRAAVVKWMTAFGKVAFDAVKLVFTYAKGKKSDLPAAFTTSPADYEKDKKSTEAKAKAPLVDRIGKIADATLDDDDAGQDDKNFALFMATQIKKYREMTAKAKPAAATSNVVEIKQAETKPVEGEETKEAAPKASRPKVAKPESDKDAAPASTIKRIKVDREASDRLASAAA
ncbi:hypothetical protein QV13_24125 [Mesorhizobium hungaricum]|jgi:hypothetical protein|uniref:Uncharacterized protein n=2 Tax=Hyphomicrobiales TaxID=356 RepID=A0A1C2DD51_9HYPH|nr:hypothetical protein QV13_24125 [Mesorhizobium hungaricum]